ncbi:hypothetical protein Tco_0640195 [Tanacetum coccineum]
MQEVILFYNGLGIPTRQILDSRGAIPSKTAADAKVAIQKMAEYYQKWHNGTSRSRSTKTSDGLTTIQAQLNNLGREIKKVNEKVYAAQDYEWYEGLEDSELKDEVLRNKAIMEGFINEGGDESRYEQERRWNNITKLLIILRYMMIKYSFNNDEEYVAVKEDKYDDPTITREEACQAYQEIFWIMDEGWMVTRAE